MLIFPSMKSICGIEATISHCLVKLTITYLHSTGSILTGQKGKLTGDVTEIINVVFFKFLMMALISAVLPRLQQFFDLLLSLAGVILRKFIWPFPL